MRLTTQYLFRASTFVFILFPFLYPVNSSPELTPETLTIVALGDSITWGYPNGRSWTEIVSRETGVKIINRGISGQTLAEMSNRLERDVLEAKPAICIIMGGTNDVFHSVPTDEMMANLKRMARILKAKGIMPVVGLPIPLGWQNSEMRLQELRNEIAEAGFVTIDFAHDFYVDAKNFKRLLPDGIHPYDQGKKIMAERLKKELPKILSAYADFIR
jgi:acyl-CoA thioesterase-1